MRTVVRTTVPSLKGVFRALRLQQEGVLKVVRCKPLTQTGCCLCFEWEKTVRARNLEKVEDHFGNLLFKNLLNILFFFFSCLKCC